MKKIENRGFFVMEICWGFLHFKYAGPHYYYVALDRVRTQGDFEGWIEFYLKVVLASTLDAQQRISRIQELKYKIRETVILHESYKRSHDLLEKVLFVLFAYPIITITKVSQELGIAYNTARNLVLIFEESGVLQQMTEQKRNKYYAFKGYLDILEDKNFVWKD